MLGGHDSEEGPFVRPQLVCVIVVAEEALEDGAIEVRWYRGEAVAQTDRLQAGGDDVWAFDLQNRDGAPLAPGTYRVELRVKGKPVATKAFEVR